MSRAIIVPSPPGEHGTKEEDAGGGKISSSSPSEDAGGGKISSASEEDAGGGKIHTTVTRAKKHSREARHPKTNQGSGKRRAPDLGDKNTRDLGMCRSPMRDMHKVPGILFVDRWKSHRVGKRDTMTTKQAEQLK